jgi:molybdate-binding protein
MGWATRIVTVLIGPDPASRLDKALGDAVPEDEALSRSRLARLIAEGAVAVNGAVVTDLRARVTEGDAATITVREAIDVDTAPEAIALSIVHEDDDLIVIDKPAGMVVHPAPGSPGGTLVNALLHHFGGNLSGIGGEKRPGIVHRIDKDTSGLLVVAKSDRAHHGLAALRRRECDIAPIHLLQADTGAYNRPFLAEGMRLIQGWRRMQGLLFRLGDPRFEGRELDAAVAAVLADPDAIMVGRNQGSGTRVLLDRLLQGARPSGYWNQPASHNAVAAAIAQGRADWGMAIRPVAEAMGLGFLAVADEHYDFATWTDPRDPEAIAAFGSALRDSSEALVAIGFTPG